MKASTLLATAISFLPSIVSAVGPWEVFETSFESAKQYENPFTQVEVIFHKDGNEWKVPAFWDGGRTWKVRFSAPEKGDNTYRAYASERSDPGLNSGERTLTVTDYTGDNPLHRHGPLRVSEDNRHFIHADGTPFFWLGDTWWKGLCKRLTWEGFQELAVDRREKGFTVVQIVCGTYLDELGLMKPSWENEGGMPYLKQDFSEVNPEYFRDAARRSDLGVVKVSGDWIPPNVPTPQDSILVMERKQGKTEGSR